LESVDGRLRARKPLYRWAATSSGLGSFSCISTSYKLGGLSVKIGKANNPVARLAELQVVNPVDLVLLLKMACKSEAAAAHLERVLLVE
jgi:hypothetical protein